MGGGVKVPIRFTVLTENLVYIVSVILQTKKKTNDFLIVFSKYRIHMMQY